MKEQAQERHPKSSIPVVLVGCGAVAQIFHAPALKSAESMGLCQVEALYDPSVERATGILNLFPKASLLKSLDELRAYPAGLAIIASPAKHHAEQCITALESGWAVLCEKPMAATVLEAEKMLTAAKSTQRPLCIGMIRRHLPAVKAIRRILDSQIIGKPVRFFIAEGGPFGWPATSMQFFKREQAHGGVLHDVGVHVLDLCTMWFGDPLNIEYEDDAMGNLEINCLLQLIYPDGLKGEIRLSRDWNTMNRMFIHCERGWIAWRPHDAQKFEMALGNDNASRDNVQDNVFQIDLTQPDSHWLLPAAGIPSMTFQQCLVRQIENALNSAIGREQPEVSGEEAMRSLKLIENCYATRRLMTMPWFCESERRRAEDFAL